MSPSYYRISTLVGLVLFLSMTNASMKFNMAPGDTCATITPNQINGTVYDDWNYSGTMDEAIINGFSNVTINVYDDTNNLVGTANTNIDGNYSVSGLNIAEEYRVEFLLPASLSSWVTVSHVGDDNGGLTQMVTAGNCASLGIADPSDYCEDNNPNIVISCFEKGNAIYGATGNENTAIVTMEYNSTGSTPVGITGLVDLYEVGSVWGMAWQASNKRSFHQAFLKRHTGLGPLGLGGVYVMDYNTVPGSLQSSFDLQGISPANGGANIDLGSVTRTGGADFALANDNTSDSHDIDGFAKIARVGYGDSEIGPDGNTLWLVNTNQRALISVDISDPSAYPGTVNQYPLSGFSGVPTCTNGVLRPWGLSFYQGKGYLGCVCTGENAGSITDVHSYILSFDPDNPTAFTNEIDFDMDYIREKAIFFPTLGLDQDGDWHPWANAWTDTGFSNAPPTEIAHAQPIITDIEFADDGSMIIGIADRFGFQMGFRDYIPVSGVTVETSVDAAGDLIKVCNVGGVWTLEGSAGCGVNDNATNSNLTNDGPGGTGEFFYDDSFDDTARTPQWNHNETFIGSLSVLKGTNEVIAAHYDPVNGDNLSFDLGLLWHNVNTGARSDEFRIVAAGPGASKGNNLGDVETVCEPAPIEIGNYVWLDSITNGIQDPTERKLDGVIVQLYDINGVLIGQDTTSDGGQYYFNQMNVDPNGITVDANGDAVPSIGYTGLDYDTDYFIVFGDTQFASNEVSLGTEDLQITPLANMGANDNIDSDIDADALTSGALGAIPDGLPFIAMTTQAVGGGDYTYDAGFRTCVLPNMDVLASSGTCTGDIANDDATIEITNLIDGDEMNFTVGTTYSGPAYGDASNLDVSDGMETLAALPHNTQYTIRVFNLSDFCYTDITAYTPSVNCCGCDIDPEDLCWDESMFNEPTSSPTFPYADTMTNIPDVDTDLSITLYQESMDPIQDSYVSPGDRCGCDFTEVATYMQCGEVFRNWKENRGGVDPDTIIFSFASPVVLDSLMFGGFRATSPNFAITEFTFFDGPNGTGNKVVSTLPDPGSIANINTGDPTTAAINILQDRGAQQTELYNGSYVYIGEEQSVRGWTVLNLGEATVQSIMWVQYVSTVDDPATSFMNMTTVGTVNSGYLSSFGFKECVCCKDPVCLPITVVRR